MIMRPSKELWEHVSGMKSVQSMGHLFNDRHSKKAFTKLGGMGKKGAVLDEAARMDLGRRRAMMIGGGLGASAVLGRHTSARSGLQPKSSAPPPSGGYNPYGGF